MNKFYYMSDRFVKEDLNMIQKLKISPLNFEIFDLKVFEITLFDSI